ncbi:MAG TPA: DUF4124 domain-containing protein [Dokdonella sp.]|uniref:DUF4124 domain-containing protein n=1 Tax=Dokdonella sp. TaxID=2291710 RepID=UPI0025C3B963|nr:DUF4124 domain-containing protein [Dokdonella sp.]MBX3692223.1 DUF4124 domain-containing protein [Dokdonella sp.]HNR90902.1 DUF4124 domain-containing protein [Dokdonella sp.]
MKPSISVLVLLLAVAGPLAAQQVYTWTDANGVKHFSDEPPPPNVKDTKKVVVRGGVTSTEDANKVAEKETTGKGPSMAAAAGYSPEDIKRNCATARRNLDVLQQSKPGADAEVEVQVEHQERIGKAQQQIALFCG